MFKKLAGTGFIVFLLLTSSYTSYSAHKHCIHELQALYKEKRFQPKNAVILWDLHGVLSKPNILQAAKHAWNLPNKTKILKALFNKKTYTTIWNLKKNGQDCSEQYAAELLKNVESLKTFKKNDAIDFINAQKPMQETVSLMKRIGKQTKGNFLLSNIGIDSWKSLQQKSGYEFLSVFDDAIVCSAQNKWKAKPHPNAFINAKRRVRKRYPNAKTFILIDDDIKNIRGARKQGIYGIHFKNAQQLQRDLRNIGFI